VFETIRCFGCWVALFNMDRKEAKLELLKIFAETKYECAYIDDAFIANFIKNMWKNIFDYCRVAIRSGQKQIYIDDCFVSSYAGNYPAHERSSVYEYMLPYIKQELDNVEVPYTTDLFTMSKMTRFKIDIEELKKFSNVEKLEILR
jgi:hypothetical protein